MKFLCVLLLVGAVLAQVDSDFAQFQQFTKQYDRSYDNVEEYMKRYFIFQENIAKAKELQAMNSEATFGITKFSDLTFEEFQMMFTGFKPMATSHMRRASVVTNSLTADQLPLEVDWRQKGVVTPVKDQGQCGSCWAFSATEELESAFAMNNTLTKLSVQQTVSCDTVDGGCGGGDTVTAYAYIKSAGGVESEADYPYTSGGGDTGTCSVDASKEIVTIDSWGYATAPCYGNCNNQNETTLAVTLAGTGTVSICVYANDAWMSYTGGVLNSKSCTHAYTDLNHCVHLIGYKFTTILQDGYWIVRNSWNTDWGDNGYIYLKYGSNMCGLADEATIITQASKV